MRAKSSNLSRSALPGSTERRSRAEWKQIFGDAAGGWKDNVISTILDCMVGLECPCARPVRTFHAHLGRRDDLMNMLSSMTWEKWASPQYVRARMLYEQQSGPPGLLGADSRRERAFNRSGIFTREQLNPFARPAGRPPAIECERRPNYTSNGHQGQIIGGADNLSMPPLSVLARQSGGRMTVASTPDGPRRTSTVEPSGNEGALRLWDWIERATAGARGRGDLMDGSPMSICPTTVRCGLHLLQPDVFRLDRPAGADSWRTFPTQRRAERPNYIIDVLAANGWRSWKDPAKA